MWEGSWKQGVAGRRTAPKASNKHLVYFDMHMVVLSEKATCYPLKDEAVLLWSLSYCAAVNGTINDMDSLSHLTCS